MASQRSVVQVISGQATLEGAGVRLRRLFGRVDPMLDPFLLLDDFSSANPEDYIAGFPWHPHRGIETVTYILDGRVEHRDSLGNRGVIGPGDVQWMTAGSGIIHQEMPLRSERLRGFQLWVNLPAASKMIAPRYRGVTEAEIPVVDLGQGAIARVIAGEVNGIRGPVSELSVEVRYIDIEAPKSGHVDLPLPRDHSVLAYVIAGDGRFDGRTERHVGAGRLAVFGAGETVQVASGSEGVRFLLISGSPLQEPVAWGGPIVMNTSDELKRAFEEYRDGTFVKTDHPWSDS